MKMRIFNITRFFLMLTLLPFAGMLTSCEDEENDASAIPYIRFEEFEENTTPTLNFTSEASSQSIKIQSNRDWSLSITPATASWVIVTPQEGSKDEELRVDVGENTSIAREVTVTVKVANSSSRKILFTINQASADGGTGEAIYQENCGSEVYKINTTTGAQDDSGRWPYIDQYTEFFASNSPWQKGGSLDQSGVSYTGTSSNVSNSGSGFGVGESGFSDAPYIGMNSASAVFTINNINVTGKTNFTFTCGSIFQSAYDNGATFGTMSNAVMTLSASIDGTNFTEIPYTVGEAVNNWALITSEFKLPESTTALSIKFESKGISTNQGSRFDDFKLVEGGNGSLVSFGTTGGGEDTEKTYTTISEVLAMYSGTAVTISEDKWIKATVISNADGGNSTSLKNLVVSDGTKGITLYLSASPSTAFALGQVVSVPLKSKTISEYSGLVQIQGVAPTEIVSESEIKALEAVSVTVSQLLSGNYQSMYVAVNNVQVAQADLSKTVGSADAHTNITIEGEGGETFSMFTAKYAKFITENVPQGSGTLKGIASVNSGNIQIQPTAATDYAGLTGARFSATVVPSLGISTSAQVAVAAKGGEYKISLTGNVNWTAEILSGATASATLDKNSGTGAADIIVTFAENTDEENAKEATVKISTTESGIEPIEVVFTQSKKSAASGPSTFTATSWDFNSASISNGTIAASAGNTNATISVVGATSFEIVSATTSYPTAKGWDASPAAWLITLPQTTLSQGSVINLSYEHRSSGTGPKTFKVEYSTDNSNWTSTGISYDLESGVYTAKDIDVTINENISDGTLYIRLVVSGNTATNGGTISAAGANRLSGGKFEISQK